MAKKNCCLLIESDSIQRLTSLRSNTTYFYVLLDNTVAFAASMYILHNYWHAQSQGGRHPAGAKPPLYMAVVNLINADVFEPPMDAVLGGTSEVRPTTRILTCLYGYKPLTDTRVP